MSVIVKISRNAIVKKEVVGKDVVDAAKDVAAELLKSWDLTTQTFMIVRSLFPVSYPAPLTKELLEKIKKYSPQRVENRVEVALPVFKIAQAEWSEDNLVVVDTTLVLPYIDEATTQDLVRLAVQSLQRLSSDKEDLE